MKKLLYSALTLATMIGVCSCSCSPNGSGTSSSDSSEQSESEYGEVSISIPSDLEYDNDSNSPYTIYPVPHDISYKKEKYYIPQTVNVVFEEGIDEATKNHLYDTLMKKDTSVNISTSLSEGKNVLVGIYNSNGIVDNYVNEDLSTLFTKIDSYYLSIDGDNIVILGKDTDACYYAITTLQWIYIQTTNVISTLKILDYSDCRYRGFIEGYYGIPWTKDERISLMEYGGLVKSNIYIYAPKDDSYHSTNWRGLYNDSDLLDLKEQIEAGNKSKTRFAWSIHPFLQSPITSSNYEEGVQAIKNKFNQLYENGVRQFVISADDVEVKEGEVVDVALHTRILNEMATWCKQKGDCYNLIFVPSAYCYISDLRLKVERDDYLVALCDGLDESVEIMWTGEDITSSVKNGKFEEFKELTNREAFMWLNWPVNDYTVDHLLMGKGEVLNKKISYNESINFTGIVTNPMQQAEESKLSIFAVSDYCWNINDFDCDASYEYSFKTIEKNVPESLMEICSHMTNGSPYEGKYFDESEDFASYIDTFEAKIDEKNYEDFDELNSLYTKIVNACEDFLENAENINLKNSMRPWVEQLKLLAEASILYLEVIENPSSQDAINKFDQAEEKVLLMEECKAPVLNKINYNTDYITVDVGVKRLDSFLITLKNLAKDEAYLTTGRYLGVTYKGFKGVYEGDVNNVVDNDESTYVWFDDYPSANAYVRIDLGEVKEIKDIYILQGTTSNSDAMVGNIEVSCDGRNFTNIGELTGVTTLLDLRKNPISGRFIRLTNTDTLTWVALREVQVNTLPELTKEVSFENIELEPSIVTSKEFMIDGNEDTFTWFGINTKSNASITLDLLNVKEINQITLLMSKESSPDDFFHEYQIYVSTDGVDYLLLNEEVYSSSELILNLDSSINVRYIKVQSTRSTPNGVVIREFNAK